MSAIFGFYGCPDQPSLMQMQNALAHRGQNVEVIQRDEFSIGYWKSAWAENCGAGLAETRSGIIALAGFQTLGPNDRIFSLAEISAHVKKHEAPPDGLSGDFVLALFTDDRFFLIRDNAGSRTVYYSRWNKKLLFASEPKGIWNIDRFPRRLEPDSLAKYLTFSFVPGQRTMLQGIDEVCPGHSLVAKPSGEYQTTRHFRFEDVQRTEANRFLVEQSVPEFRATFFKTTADRLRLIGDNQPVVFLSGGLDSSVVAAEIARQSNRKPKTYSLHFGDRYPNELEFARMVAKKNRLRSP